MFRRQRIVREHMVLVVETCHMTIARVVDVVDG